MQKKNGRYYPLVEYHKKRYRPGRSFRTASEANNWQVQKRQELEQGIIIDNQNVTVKEFAIKWLQEYVAPDNRESSLSTYESKLRNAILPNIGHHNLRDLNQEHIRNLQNNLLSKYAQTTVRETMKVVRMMLKAAKESHYIYDNPAQVVKMLKKPKIKRPILTTEQLFTLLENAPIRERTAIALGGMAGLRVGEVFGMKWRDVDLKNGFVSIKQQYSRRKISELKSESSEATLPIFEELLLILKEYRLKCQSTLWLFAGRFERPRLPTTWEIEYFKPLLKRCNLPDIRFHDLRHTFINLMLERGVSIHDVKYLARHKSITVTSDMYGQEVPSI
jgi:integrase